MSEVNLFEVELTEDDGRALYVPRGFAHGFYVLADATDHVPEYPVCSGWTRRAWAESHRDTLVRFIRAFARGSDWALDPANKAEAIALLADRLKLAPQVAAQSYAVATDPADGIAKDAKLDMDGFKNVLKLRAEIEGQWGGNPPSPEKYLDLSYYDRALASIR